jgi:hypothetical protein
MYVGYTNSFSIRLFVLLNSYENMVEQNICNVNIFLTCADMRASPGAWIFCTIPLYLFVPLKIGTAKPLSACLYKTLTLMLYNLINHPNLMGARRSCGQCLFSNFWEVTRG